MKKYVLGLDLGIGSIGWGLIDAERGQEKIIDFGVRLFNSGELNGGKDRTSQKRRGFRGTRRVLRRRAFRKDLLKQHFEYIKLATKQEIENYFETAHNNVYQLRTAALDNKLTANELCAVLIHIAGHRGYKEFYDTEEDNISTQDMKDELEKNEKEDKMGVDAFLSIMKKHNYRTVGEMFYRDEVFKSSIKNKNTKTEKYLPTRKEVVKETSQILQKQKEFYPQLTTTVIERTMDIIFSQRDFEDGPGNRNDPYRKYKGFLDSIGKCIFYGKERGFRGTVISDMYAVTNILSQYSYIDMDIKDNVRRINLKPEVAYELLYTFIQTGTLTNKDIKAICNKHNTIVNMKETSKNNILSKSIKYIRRIKRLIEDSGLHWLDFANEEQLDLARPSKLHQIGEILSKYQTPRRKAAELRKLEWIDEKMIQCAMAYKFSGTANVCYSYMIDAIKAFINGESYGNFQANTIKELGEQSNIQLQYKLPLLQDEYITKNPVVFRTINETRKVINAIIDKYGSPSVINIEVASEVNRSYEERKKIEKLQKKNENLNDNIRKKIIEKFNIIYENDIRPVMIEKYKLYEKQEGKCLYSNKVIELEQLFSNAYEIDHIVPYSLILDNSLNNKALVLRSENQYKRQRTPLEYLSKDKSEVFLAKVNEMFRADKINNTKYAYLTLPNIYSPECQEMMKDWKSRNINDTRYITKYITKYIAANLIFASDTRVHGIKGGYTAKFRRLWLNETTWGSKEREFSNLHHAVDAVVVANLTPAYIEIASDNIKLYQIFKSAGKVENSEYKEYLEKSINKMKKYYFFDEDYTRSLLTRKGKVPSVIPNLRDEVDIRFNDYDETLFVSQINSFYRDKEFAENIRMPLVSYKHNKKLQGDIADSNPLRIRKIGDDKWKVKRTPVIDLTLKQIDNIHSEDKDLIKNLSYILEGKSEKYTIGNYLKENNLSNYVTPKGTVVHKVSIKDGQVENPYYKIISDKNKTALAANKYYCTEIYKNIKEETCLRGIRIVDIIKKDKKLWLKCDYPDNYAKHIMYLFYNEYIEVIDKNGSYKFKGFFKSSSILGKQRQQRIVGAKLNKPYSSSHDYFTLSKGDIVEKYYIGLLGEKGGKVKCGEPLSLLKDKK